MQCSNNLCTGCKDKDIPLLFTCDRCREQHYCSQICKTTDWNLGHHLLCKEIRLSKLKSAEKTCPYIKSGTYLSNSEADKAVTEGKDVHTRYEPQDKLGKGSYGEVILMKDKITNQPVAVKIIDKRGINTPQMKKALKNEIEIHKHLVHENIIKMLGYIESNKSMYIIMEYASAGSLFQLIRRRGKLSEKEAFFFFTQTCSAIHFLHSQNLMHRDIKPENLLLTDKGEIKLCDFGCCVGFDEKTRIEFCGTVEYMAPELFKKERYDEKIDIWSLGILLYEMLHGYTPYMGKTEKDTIAKIKEGKMIFRNVSEDAKELIEAAVNTDPKLRLEVWEILIHPWVKRIQKEVNTTNKGESSILLGLENTIKGMRRRKLIVHKNDLRRPKGNPISKSLQYKQIPVRNFSRPQNKQSDNIEPINSHTKLNQARKIESSKEIIVMLTGIVGKGDDTLRNARLPPRHSKHRQDSKDIKGPIKSSKASSIKSKQNESDSTVEECGGQKSQLTVKSRNSRDLKTTRVKQETFTDLCENLKECEEGITSAIKASNYRGSNQNKASRTPMNVNIILYSKLNNTLTTNNHSPNSKERDAVLYNGLLPNDMNIDLNN